MTKSANGQTNEVPVGNDAPDNDANFHWLGPWNYDAVTLKEARSAQPGKVGNVAIPDTTDSSGNLAGSRDAVSVSRARVNSYTVQYSHRERLAHRRHMLKAVAQMRTRDRVVTAACTRLANRLRAETRDVFPLYQVRRRHGTRVHLRALDDAERTSDQLEAIVAIW